MTNHSLVLDSPSNAAGLHELRDRHTRTLTEPSVSIDARIDSAILARFTGPFFSGAAPYGKDVRLEDGLDIESALGHIPTAVLVCRYVRPDSAVALIEDTDYAAIVHRYERGSGSISVRAATPEQVDSALAEITSWFPPVVKPATTVSVDFWQSGRHMYTTSRSIEAPSWEAVTSHYPAEVQTELADLMACELDEPVGRVILWHGPPGTGKTSAIRALARAWEDQATFQVVLDPEPVFQRSANLMQVLLDSDDSNESKWRVLVIEDADDIVRADNAHTSQSLSRLLNVGDGIVGQGLKVLVLLTTNERPERLHPALIRPGRCLVNLAFRNFSLAEARHGFPDKNILAELTVEDLSLAEIMTGQIDRPRDHPMPGQYL